MESTASLESPTLFRKWAGISLLAAVAEQKIHVVSGGEQMYPNLFCFLVAHPGVGKTRSIRAARKYYAETPDPSLAPTSLTASSMIDALGRAKRKAVYSIGGELETLEYNSLYITADELQAFMKEYNTEAAATMSAFYDIDPYGQERRHDDFKVKIPRPQLNLVCGATPSVIMTYLPVGAWEQGFCSRTIMVFSDERQIGDDFEERDTSLNPDLIHDLNCIAGLVGRFEVTEEYRNAVNGWRKLGEDPVPTHPKLIHYATRRRVHLYKLSMVSAIDRSDTLLLTRDDFNRAMGWLLEAEATMPDIFKAGSGNADARAMDEIYHYVLTLGATRGPVPEGKIIKFAKEHIPLHSIERVIRIMTQAGMLVEAGLDRRTGLKLFKAQVPDIDVDGNLL